MFYMRVDERLAVTLLQTKLDNITGPAVCVLLFGRAELRSAALQHRASTFAVPVVLCEYGTKGELTSKNDVDAILAELKNLEK